MGKVVPLTPAPALSAPRGRPGDWSEPLDLQVDRDALDRAAKDLELDPDLLAALLVERQLALTDLAEAGLADPQMLLNRAATAEGMPAVGPGNLLFGYLRDLRQGQGTQHESSVDRWLMLPVRLHESLRRAGLAVDPADAEEARRWEVAAAMAGLQMREWALRVALLTR